MLSTLISVLNMNQSVHFIHSIRGPPTVRYVITCTHSVFRFSFQLVVRVLGLKMCIKMQCINFFHLSLIGNVDSFFIIII